MRHKPNPETYSIALPGITATLTITPTGAFCVVSPVVRLEWEWVDDEGGPLLVGLGYIGFEPPSTVIGIIKDKDGNTIYVGAGSYAPL